MKASSQPFSQTLTDQAYDLLGEMILERETAQLLAQIDEERRQGETARMDAFFTCQEKKHRRQIQHFLAHQRRVHFFTVSLPRALRIAAMIVMVLLVVGGSALAVSPQLRTRVWELIYQTMPQWTDARMVDSALLVDVPDQWNGRKYLSWLPSGLELSNVQDMQNLRLVEYRDENTKKVKLLFQEMDENGIMNLNSEDAEVKSVAINEYEALFIRRQEVCTLCWTDGVSSYLLSTHDMTDQETMDIACKVIDLY